MPSTAYEEEGESLIGINHGFEVKNTKPYKFVFLGEEMLVNSYVGMLDGFIHLLYDVQPELISQLAKKGYTMTTSDRIYIGYDTIKMRKPKEIAKTGIFYESNLSSEYILLFIKNLILKSEFDIEDFEFGLTK